MHQLVNYYIINKYFSFFYLCSVCCLHDTLDDKTEITLFSNIILSKYQEILKARKDQKLKYSIVELPVVPDNIHGYHIMICLGRFTIKKKAC